MLYKIAVLSALIFLGACQWMTVSALSELKRSADLETQQQANNLPSVRVTGFSTPVDGELANAQQCREVSHE